MESKEKFFLIEKYICAIKSKNNRKSMKLSKEIPVHWKKD